MGDLWPSLTASTLATDVGLNRTHESMMDYDDDLSTVQLFVDYPTPLLHFASACCIIFMLVGIPGNLITIAALARCKKVRNATAVFIMNLSCSDLLFCCFNLPLSASTFWARGWLHGRLLCRLFPLLRYGLLAVSLFTVLAITINRYVMIGHPTLYPKLYRQRYLGVMVGSTWLSGFGALAATWFDAWGEFGLDRRIGSCSILPDRRGRSPKEFLFVVAFVLPCLAIVVCYARIFYIVRKTALQSRGHKCDQRKPISSNCQNSNATESNMENNLLMKPLTKLPNKNNYLTAEDSALGSISTATTAAEKSLSFANEKSSPKAEKNDSLYSEAGVTKENGINDLNGNNNNKKKNVSQMLNFKLKKEKPDPNLLSPPDTYYKPTEKKSKKIILEPSSSSGIDTFDDQENTSMRSNTSIDSSPTNTSSRRKSRSSRFASIPSLTRMTSVVRRDGKKSKRRATPAPVSNGYPGKMSTKDKKLLKMILVIFVSFLVCYLPITITKIFRDVMDIRALNIAGYILIYLTTCINPIIYVVMSSEYRQAYKNLIMCKGFGQDLPRRP